MTKNEDTYGIEITKINKIRNTTSMEKIKRHFQKHKDKAYRCCELERIFRGKMTESCIRSCVRTLHYRKILKKRQIANNITYYYYNKDYEK